MFPGSVGTVRRLSGDNEVPLSHFAHDCMSPSSVVVCARLLYNWIVDKHVRLARCGTRAVHVFSNCSNFSIYFVCSRNGGSGPSLYYWLGSWQVGLRIRSLTILFYFFCLRICVLHRLHVGSLGRHAGIAVGRRCLPGPARRFLTFARCLIYILKWFEQVLRNFSWID